MSQLLTVIRLAKANGLNISALVTWLIAHKAEIAAAIQFLLELFNQPQGFAAAGPEPSGDEVVAELTSCGVSAADAEEVAACC